MAFSQFSTRAIPARSPWLKPLENPAGKDLLQVLSEEIATSRKALRQVDRRVATSRRYWPQWTKPECFTNDRAFLTTGIKWQTLIVVITLVSYVHASHAL